MSMPNDWGSKANEELAAIEHAITAVCSPSQVLAIRKIIASAAHGVLIESDDHANRQ